jgi:type II secretory pathway pseudopilin PulG
MAEQNKTVPKPVAKPQPVSSDNEIALPPKKHTGLVVVLVLVILLGIAAIAGTWYFMNKKINDQKDEYQKQVSQLNQKIEDLEKQTEGDTTASTESPSKEYTTKYEKITFTYPDSFTLTDTSKAEGDTTVDTVKLSKGDFNLSLLAGVYGIGGACDKCKVLYTEPISVLGNKMHLNYVSNDGGPKADRVIVAKTPTDTFGFFEGKNVKVDGNNALIGISLGYSSGDKLIPKTVQELQSDPNVAQAKQIIQSMKY